MNKWITLVNQHNEPITINIEAIDYIAEYNYLLDRTTITVGLRSSHKFHLEDNKSNRDILASAIGYK